MPGDQEKSVAVGRSSDDVKRFVKRAVRAVAPTPQMLAGLASLRTQVDANSQRLDDLVNQIAALTNEISGIRAGLEGLRAEHVALSNLDNVVFGMGERVHSHELALRDVRAKLEQFGGSVLDEMAVVRRLRNIEDRILPEGDGDDPRAAEASSS